MYAVELWSCGAVELWSCGAVGIVSPDMRMSSTLHSLCPDNKERTLREDGLYCSNPVV